VPAIGIEPAANVAKLAEEKGITTITDFFGTRLAEQLVTERGEADLIVANNALAHVPDINDFVNGIQCLLKPHGVATLEFPYIERLIAETQFDTIYHEHFSYLSVSVVVRIAHCHGLRLVDVEKLRWNYTISLQQRMSFGSGLWSAIWRVAGARGRYGDMSSMNGRANMSRPPTTNSVPTTATPSTALSVSDQPNGSLPRSTTSCLLLARLDRCLMDVIGSLRRSPGHSWRSA
jgi:hypothetical protein